jgi:hypothetical protein
MVRGCILKSFLKKCYLAAPPEEPMRKTFARTPSVFCSCLFVMFALPFFSWSQEKIKFGKPVLADLQMKLYEKDSAAHAVILYDRGHLNGTNFDFRRHLRIKVLTNAGTSFANFSISTPSKSNISGYTYNMEEGEIVTRELENSNIYSEAVVNGLRVNKIFFPHVKPGTVIDLYYVHKGLPAEWRFQDRVPVAYSELVLEPTSGLVFKKTMYGTGQVRKQGNITWIAEHMPALKEEPYMAHYSNYLTRFKFDLEGVYGGGYVHQDISESWASVGRLLSQDPNFGAVIRECAFLNEKADEIKKGNAEALAKVRDAYDYIRTNIKWNQSKSVFANSTYKDNFKKYHSGNSAEINLLLIGLLRKAGITTYPLVLSTRDHGMIHPVSASLTTLNYVVAYVKHEGLEIILDATSEHLIPGVVPDYCLNMFGWVLGEPEGWIVEMIRSRANVVKDFVRIGADASNVFQADLSRTYEDYAYLDWITEYDRKGSMDAYGQSVKASYPDLGIGKFEVKIVEKEKLRSMEQMNVRLTGSDYVQDLGKSVYINPFIMYNAENPFKALTREYPVDFGYPRTRQFTVVVTVPQGFEIKKFPESVSFSAENGGAKFSYAAMSANNTISIRCEVKIERQFFNESEYQILRTFFSEVGKKMNEVIELNKKT